MKNENEIKSPVTKKTAKVPVVMQMEALECGAASLCMVLGYYGRFVPLSKLRKECGVSRDGSNAKSILMVARSYGLQTKANRFTAKKLKEAGTFPCILFWENRHFVVLKGIKNGKFYINDPGLGAVIYEEEEFTQRYSKIVLFFAPSESFEKGGKPESVLRFVKHQLKGTGKMICLLGLIYFVIIATSLILASLPVFFVDEILADGGQILWKNVFFIGFTVLAVMKIAASALQCHFMFKIHGKMAISASSTFFWHLLRMPMVFFSQRTNGDLILRMASNETIASTLIVEYAPLALDLISMVFYLIMMIFYSPLMACIGLASVCINILISYFVYEKRLNLSRVSMKTDAEIMNATYTSVNMMETIKVSGVEEGFFGKWADIAAKGTEEKCDMRKLDSFWGQIAEFVSDITAAVVLCFGVVLILNGQWTMGIISAFTGYLAAFTDPAAKLMDAISSFQELKTDMERVEDVMNYEAELPEEFESFVPEDEYNLLDGKIEFRHVTFGYNHLTEPLISDFNMTVEPGKSVAFVGSSGSGKSTLAKLLTGLYQPWDGEILFDGKRIDEIKRSIFNASVEAVDQEISIFADTIANNIKMWDNTIEDYEVIMAARDAQIHYDIIKREDGYATELTSGGKNISGGQRQRLEIARALAGNPTIIVLDEATSALDADTEFKVMRAIRNLGITMVVISHRLSTIRDCDEIIVLKNGQVIDRGKHDELMERSEYYQEMITNE